jgi:hypothetical protein
MAGEFLWEPIFEQLRQQELDRQNALKTEAMQVENEQAKIKQAMVAKALEAMQGGFSQGGERRDVGGFSRGGSTMQDTVLGPGGPQLYDESKTQYTAPGTGGTPQQRELARKAMGLSGRDPQEVLQEKLLMEAIKDTIISKRQGDLETRKERFQRETAETSEKGRKEAVAEKERLYRERPKSNQMKEELLKAKFEGRWTPQHQAVWDLMHPLERLVMGSVKERLAGNAEYMITMDPKVKDRIRSEELAKALKEMDMLRTGEREEEDEDDMSEEEALALLTEAGGNKDKARKLAEAKKKGKK